MNLCKFTNPSASAIFAPQFTLFVGVQARPPLQVAAYENPYAMLGVSATCSDEKEIKRAYRSAAKEWHPDVSKKPEAEKTFLKLTGENCLLKQLQSRKC